MGNQISIRMDDLLMARAEALAARLNKHSSYRALNLTRAAVLRMAMLEGLDAMEKRWAEAAK